MEFASKLAPTKAPLEFASTLAPTKAPLLL